LKRPLVDDRTESAAGPPVEAVEAVEAVDPEVTGAGSSAGHGVAVVVVSLGTDHHPFQRLVDWVDHWAAAHPGVRCLIQYGPASIPTHADGIAFLPSDLLRSALSEATIVVGHAGPGTIVDAHGAGRLPIVVPRLARLGEVVDDHQIAFGRWMAARGHVLLAEDEHELHRLLDEGLDNPSRLRVEDGAADRSAAVQLVGDLFDELMR
jgi:UDP-N-acetylglucosamine transferase subunit ALG13